MSENLKVNANSSVLEHKRKHNLLVEKMGFDLDGNINFDGNFSANSIIENMNGYSFTKETDTVEQEYDYVYAGACKNGNKLTLVLALNLNVISAKPNVALGGFTIPSSVGAKLFTVNIGGYNYLINTMSIATNQATFVRKQFNVYVIKLDGTTLGIAIGDTSALDIGTSYIRLEFTFLLSDNLISQE